MNLKKGWKVVKQDERYLVTDNDTLNKLVTSITELNPKHSTTVHKHVGQEEVYIFRLGKGDMEINKKRFKSMLVLLNNETSLDKPLKTSKLKFLKKKQPKNDSFEKILH